MPPNLVVRRTYRVEWDPRSETGEHTAGLVQIVAADEHASVAVVIYACNEMMPGDRLASFNPEPLRPPAPAGDPDYRYAARIPFPDIGQLLGAPLWNARIGNSVTNGPITYELDGLQYVIAGAGSRLVAFVLNQ